MPTANTQPDGHDLVSNLRILQYEAGLTVDRIADARALLRVCGQTPANAAVAREHVVSALNAMQDSPGGRALSCLYNIEQAPSTLAERIASHATTSGMTGDDRVVQLAEDAIDELALRLLGKYYRIPGDNCGRNYPKYAIMEKHVACIIRNRRLIETRQRWTIMPLEDGVTEFEYCGALAQLTDVANGEVSTREDKGLNRSIHRISFCGRVMERGTPFKFGFREVLDPVDSNGTVVDTQYAVRFDCPILHYQVGLRFIGERPAKVWAYSSPPARRSQRPPTAGLNVSHTNNQYGAVEFRHQYEGVAGLAWRWRNPNALSLCFGVACFALATLNWIALAHREGSLYNVAAVAILLLLAMVGTLSVHKYFAARNRRRFKNSHGHNELIQLPESAARALQYGAADTGKVDARQSAILALSILKPRLLRQRVVEEYELGRRTLIQRITIEAQIPRKHWLGTAGGRDLEATGRPIYFAILVPKKSNFQDKFSVTDGAGAAIPILSYREYLQLVAAVLRLLLATAFSARTLSIPSKIKAAELDALRLIMSRRTADGVAPNINLDTEWHKELSPAEGDRRAIEAYRSALALVRTLDTHYAIVAIVQPDANGRFILRCERTLIPDLVLSGRKRFAVMIGARPIDLSISLKTASTSQSFHLVVNATEDLYLGEQRLLGSTKTLKRIADDEAVPPHYRFRRRLGQPHAHFYSRFFPEPDVATDSPGGEHEQPHVRLKYFEAPPGSLLRAVVSAIACVLLVTIIGIIGSRNLDPGSDAAAFLLVFPAVVAAWLGFDSPSRRLLEGTIVARLSLLVTVITSISASGLYMAHKALTTVEQDGQTVTYNWWKLPREWSILWINDVSWLALTLIALANAVAVIYFYVSRTAYFTYLVSRDQGGDVQQHG